MSTTFKQMIAEIGMDFLPENFKALQYSVDNDKPLLIIGESGTGKTSMVQQYGKYLKKKVYRINLNGQTGTEDILGRWTLKGGETVWMDGLLVKAMKEGAWIIFDEINAAHPDVLFVLHSLLDHDKEITLVEKNSETIKPTNGFRFFATMNPESRYAGTKSLNLAFKSRFPLIITVDYSTKEKAIIKSRTKIKDKDALTLSLVADALRNMYKANTTNYPCTTRDLIYTAELAKKLPLQQAIRFGIINKFEEEEKQAVVKSLEIILGFISHNKDIKSPTDIIEKYEQVQVELKEEVSKNSALEAREKELEDNLKEVKTRLQETINEKDKIIESLQSTTKEQIKEIISKEYTKRKKTKK